MEHAGRLFRARGLSTDIVEASARAYLAAINRIATHTRNSAKATKPAHP